MNYICWKVYLKKINNSKINRNYLVHIKGDYSFNLYPNK